MNIKQSMYYFKSCVNKFASEGNPEELLKQAISTGDRATYEIFLDLLEEANPKLREQLKSSELQKKLKILSINFPQIIQFSRGYYFFHPHFLGKVSSCGSHSAIKILRYVVYGYDIEIFDSDVSITFDDNTYDINEHHIVALDGVGENIETFKIITDDRKDRHGEPISTHIFIDDLPELDKNNAESMKIEMVSKYRKIVKEAISDLHKIDKFFA